MRYLVDVKKMLAVTFFAVGCGGAGDSIVHIPQPLPIPEPRAAKHCPLEDHISRLNKFYRPDQGYDFLKGRIYQAQLPEPQRLWVQSALDAAELVSLDSHHVLISGFFDGLVTADQCPGLSIWAADLDVIDESLIYNPQTHTSSDAFVTVVLGGTAGMSEVVITSVLSLYGDERSVSEPRVIRDYQRSKGGNEGSAYVVIPNLIGGLKWVKEAKTFTFGMRYFVNNNPVGHELRFPCIREGAELVWKCSKLPQR